jgi:V/A-type H+/Na+-transporting ATPase subunit E
MSIDVLVNSIIEEAEKEAGCINEKIALQIADIEQEAEKKVNLVIEQILEKANERAYREQDKKRISANLDRKKAVLEEKQNAISLSFDTVLRDLHQLDKVKFQAIIANMLKDCRGDEEVIIDPKEERIDRSFIENVNKKLLENGKKGNLRLSDKTREISGGGFILSEGRIEKNCSFAVYLNDLRKDLESSIAEILFSSK